MFIRIRTETGWRVLTLAMKESEEQLSSLFGLLSGNRGSKLQLYMRNGLNEKIGKQADSRLCQRVVVLVVAYSRCELEAGINSNTQVYVQLLAHCSKFQILIFLSY